MFGALYGDVIGSYYELHCTKDYHFPLQKDSFFTDDSVLCAAVCKAILAHPEPITKWQITKRAKEYGAHYRSFYARYPRAGFGNMFSKWARDPYASRGRSYGNGACMRVIPIGYAYDSLEQTLLQAKASCLCTHSHREAIKGAKAVAGAVFLARKGANKEEISRFVQKSADYDLSVPLEELRATHVFNSRTSYSVPPAIISFLSSNDYESAVRNAVSLGGDADTQACIAGGIAEAFYKEIPEHLHRFCDSKIDIGLKSVVREFCKQYPVQ